MLKATDNPHSEPGKPLSAAFELYMGIFVDAQDKLVQNFTTSSDLTDTKLQSSSRHACPPS